MNTERLSQEEKELEKVELLNEFQMEELEQRFEMSAVDDGVSLGGDPQPGTVPIATVSWSF